MDNKTLLELYKQDKAAMDDIFQPVDPFTGEVVESFPTFSQWKKQYMAECAVKVSKDFDVDEAMKIADNVTELAEQEFDSLTATKEVMKMTEKATEVKTEVKTEEEAKGKSNATAVTKPTTKKATKGSMKTSVKSPKEKRKSKMQEATTIYKRMIKKDGTHPTRKEVMVKLKERLGMTDNGASTYYYNIKRKLSS